MSSNLGTNSNEAASRLQASCPYVGMVSDPQTHVGIPDSRNFCHLVNPPREVVIGHQQGHCLGQHFSNCPIYKSSGEEESAEGVFEEGEGNGRGFGLFHFGRRSQTKPVKQEPNVPAAVVVPVAAAVLAPEAVPEPVKKIIPAPEPEPLPDPAIVASTTEAAAPVDDEEELRMRLYNEALNRYEQVNNTKKERKGFWVLLMIAAIFVLAISMWGIYTRSQNLLRQSQVEAEMSYTLSLATAVQDMGAASEAWGTAAGIIESRERTATAMLLGSAAALQGGTSLEGTASAATAMALIATPTSQAGICQNIAEANFQVVSGPALIPAERTLYQPGLQTPQAAWVVQNTGNCGWSQILLWSVLDNTITQPIIKRNGQEVLFNSTTNQALIAPGEQIELVLEFPAAQAQRIFNEWVVVADGLSLVSQPHLSLRVDNWISLEQFARPTSTRLVRKTPSGGSNPGTTPGVEPPRSTSEPVDPTAIPRP